RWTCPPGSTLSARPRTTGAAPERRRPGSIARSSGRRWWRPASGPTGWSGGITTRRSAGAPRSSTFRSCPRPEPSTLMTTVLTFVRSHPLLVAVHVLGIAVALRVLVTRRAPQSLMAWLLGLVFAPWVAVPLYLLLGGRKFPRGAKGKQAPLLASAARAELPGTHPATNVPRVLR